MKVYAFSALAFVAVFGLAFVATKLSAPAEKPPEFNYETANRSEQIVFLTSQAAPIITIIERGLGKSMELQEPLINPEQRRITFRIEVAGRLSAKLDSRSIKLKAYRRLCPGYMESALGKNAVTVVQKFIAKDGTGNLMGLRLSKRICEQVV